MNVIRQILILSIIILINGCASINVKTTFNPKVDFKQYKTFSWIDGSGPMYEGPEYIYSKEQMLNLKEVIQLEMKNKDLVLDETEPDVLIGFHVIIQEELTTLISHQEMSSPYGTSLKYWDGYADFYNEDPYRFLKGTLVIDLIDAKGGNVIWQSTAYKYMDIHPTIEENEIHKSIVRTLRDFPPK